MRLAVTEEQRELRAVLRRFFADRSPSGEVRRLMATAEGHDPAVWRQMADQLGLQGLAVPEEYGGAGCGLRELVVVLEEMGRALVCAPFLASAVLAAHAVLASGDEEARRDLLPGLADGTVIGTLAHTADGDAGGTAMTAEADRLTGTVSFVLDGHVAGLILVVARTPRGPSLFAVDGDAPGLTRTLLSTLDQTRRLARLECAGTPARPVGPAGAGARILARTLDVAAVALAAEQLGGAQRVLEMSVEYAKVRHQFGRPIGSFQAVKHKCADMLVEVESARSAVLYAATVADEDPAELPMAAALAQAYASEAFFHAAGENIQIHGGIGFTWEHDAHLYFKRAKSSQLLFGSPALHRERVAKLIGL
ncbi:acyl-CoA dehydrogenase family protein [Thermomonospora cellulosilytica]|uniref:Alkylation response protein AidB-like acyl-CoA dehydrogenase n=1 Tax=Thermomonospora cellulosilytica TaxID=1411118 RepID=A0A7W3MZJ2_9ACTN|nr:acyl-CoA dehydrogenase family protein [Thermomonospora cellulosilytica]MBA9004764.1 alkylation response protein AidB-like acyl-CoA dehydrogenase [Thermomonospora cellulosilytica]